MEEVVGIMNIQSRITPEVFYKVGSILFFIIALCQIFNYVVVFDLVGTVWGHIMTIGQIIFSFLLFGFFLYLLQQTPKINNSELSSFEEIKREIE